MKRFITAFNRCTLRLSISGILLMTMACARIDQPEEIPAFISIDSFQLTANIDSFGANTSNISDVWILIGDNKQGVYELPASFPILLQGAQQVIFEAGIRINGINATRVSYPFYTQHIETIDFKSGESYQIRPQITYRSATRFAMTEDFEFGNAFDQMKRLNNASDCRSGSGCGQLRFEPGDPFVVAALIDSFFLPLGAQNVFLEMDYRNNVVFQCGITGIRQNERLSFVKINLNPSENWNKIYINFTPEINQLNVTRWKLFFRYQPTDPSIVPDIRVDNLKVLYF